MGALVGSLVVRMALRVREGCNQQIDPAIDRATLAVVVGGDWLGVAMLAEAHPVVRSRGLASANSCLLQA